MKYDHKSGGMKHGNDANKASMTPPAPQSQYTGDSNEPILCGKESMHPRSYLAEMKVEQAAMDYRDLAAKPVKTGKFKG
ncbi:MAG: hypothetical protein ACRD98_00405 [Nitrososphaera sp.]